MGHLVFSLHSFDIQRKIIIYFLSQGHFNHSITLSPAVPVSVLAKRGHELTNEEVPEDTESSRLLFGSNNREHTDSGYVSKTSIPSAISDETPRAQIILAEKKSDIFL